MLRRPPLPVWRLITDTRARNAKTVLDATRPNGRACTPWPHRDRRTSLPKVYRNPRENGYPSLKAKSHSLKSVLLPCAHPCRGARLACMKKERIILNMHSRVALPQAGMNTHEEKMRPLGASSLTCRSFQQLVEICGSISLERRVALMLR